MWLRRAIRSTRFFAAHSRQLLGLYRRTVLSSAVLLVVSVCATLVKDAEWIDPSNSVVTVGLLVFQYGPLGGIVLLAGLMCADLCLRRLGGAGIIQERTLLSGCHRWEADHGTFSKRAIPGPRPEQFDQEGTCLTRTMLGEKACQKRPALRLPRTAPQRGI